MCLKIYRIKKKIRYLMYLWWHTYSIKKKSLAYHKHYFQRMRSIFVIHEPCFCIIEWMFSSFFLACVCVVGKGGWVGNTHPRWPPSLIEGGMLLNPTVRWELPFLSRSVITFLTWFFLSNFTDVNWFFWFLHSSHGKFFLVSAF